LILPNAGAIVIASALAPRLTTLLGPRRTVMISVTIMALAAALFAGVQADWSAIHEIALITMFGFGFGLGMPALTDAIMAAVPVEDAGVGSAVNDVSRELGSALGVAVLGSFIAGVYRGNVEETLGGRVDDEVIVAAKEGLGVLAGQDLTPAVAQTAAAGASEAFIDAMNSGFWLSAGVLATGVAVAAFMLPNRARVVQVARDDATERADRSDRPAAAGDPEPALAGATAATTACQ
jgi:Na+/melibiose symporter-like transporter